MDTESDSCVQQGWNYRILLVAFLGGWILKSLLLPCLCYKGVVSLHMALAVDVMILIRVLVAYRIKEQGRGWIFYSILTVASGPMILSLVEWAD